MELCGAYRAGLNEVTQVTSDSHRSARILSQDISSVRSLYSARTEHVRKDGTWESGAPWALWRPGKGGSWEGVGPRPVPQRKRKLRKG